jgi:hypothetical protein
MAIEDCYFYLTTGCTKGQNCAFRHSPGALNTLELCPEYATTGTCHNPDCGKRHSTFHLNTTKSNKSYNDRTKWARERNDVVPKQDANQLNPGAPAFTPQAPEPAPINFEASSMREWKKERDNFEAKLLEFGQSFDAKFNAISNTLKEIESIEENIVY